MSFRSALKRTFMQSPNEKIELIRKPKFEPTERVKDIKDKSLLKGKLFKEDYLFMEGKYIGQLNKNQLLPHGYGIFIENDTGALYEGWRKNGLRCGPGRQIESSGLVYDGEWLNNLPNGFGQVVYPDLNAFEGIFVDAKRQGYGKYIL